MDYKIALIDIDNCLISNENSQYNEALLAQIANTNYTHIWLFSGRMGSESWIHVLRFGKPAKDWRQQLICNLLDYFETHPEVIGNRSISGVSLPYDHTLEDTKPGQGYEKSGLKSLEQKINATIEDPKTFLNTIKSLTPHDDDIVMQLALNGDFAKGGQFCHWCDGFISRHKVLKTDTMHIDYYDDKPENLENVLSIIQEKYSQITARIIQCDLQAASTLCEIEHCGNPRDNIVTCDYKVLKLK